MIESVILTVTAGIVLLGYKLYDSNKDMERHFHKHAIHNYYLLQFAVIVLSFSFFFHGRKIVMDILKFGWKRINS